MQQLKTGSTLQNGKYVIEKVLGQGSFGITYLASMKMKVHGELGDLDMTIKVAIKEFFMWDVNGRTGDTVTSGSKGGLYGKYKQKFVKEAQNLSKLHHPNIIKVLESFEANNTVYYVMEYIDGGSLDELIKQKGKLSEDETLRLTSQIASALSFMHSHKMLHLDLKPSNIMLKDGNAVLIDFGLSKQYDDDGNPESSTTIGAGTPGYAPIEQSTYKGNEKGVLPVTMDIYALGGTMFKMLTGVRPPDASDVMNDGLPALPSTVSASTQNAVTRAMQFRRADRPASVEAFVKILPQNVAVGDNESTIYEVDVEVKDSKNETSSGSGIKFNDSNKKPYEEKAQEATGPKRDVKKTVLRFLGAFLVVFVIVAGVAWMVDKPTWVTDSDLVSSGSISGHEYVDLGLSVKWATCNVGADSPEDYGDYFAWGETKPKSSYTEENSVTYKKYMGSIAGNPQYDAARANWGGSWRLPTEGEIDELISNCTTEWAARKGINGHLVTSKINGNSIFLPAAGWRDGTSGEYVGEFGYYWSATPDESSGTGDACYLRFISDFFNSNWNYRYDGLSVRPVSE